jgi:hypothetical protein
MMGSCIDAHRDAYGVGRIGSVLPIAPSTYYEHAARRANPALLPARATLSCGTSSIGCGARMSGSLGFARSGGNGSATGWRWRGAPSSA